ncbi:MAG: hypothetical protein RLZZ488_1032 [Pseudomonadota bacterium]|jgi:hypothetical protein
MFFHRWGEPHKDCTLSNVVGIVTAVAAFSLAVGCGKKKASVDQGSDLGQQGQLAISFAAANGNSDGSSFSLSDNGFAPVKAEPSSIASGAPDSFEVSILSMALSGSGSNGGTTSVNIFNSDSGKPVRITGSEIDLSQLFTTYECVKKDGTPLTLAAGETCKCGLDKDDKVIAPQADGSCKQTDDSGQLVDITEPAGLVNLSASTYDKLKVTFAPKAKIKGCVSATFRSDTGTIANGSVGAQTYCTQSGLATTNENITPAHGQFKNVSAEETEIFLSKSWSERSRNVTVEFPIKDGLKINQGSKANLTMVIDVNRMLRFYNMGRTDQGPNPEFPTNRAYFFTTVFEESLFVFAGKAGGIRGYNFQTETCIETFQNSYSCTGSARSVDGWITLILDANGTPFAANVMPDDDNNLTTIKGGNRKASIGIDPTMIIKNADNTYQISVTLQGDTNPTINKFDLSGAVGSSFTTTYRGISGAFNGGGAIDSFGNIKLTRGL